jgi:hypothetical protein
MASSKRRNGFAEHYVLGLRSSTKHNAPAYGYSVAAGATLAALTKVDGSPSLLDVFLFIIGASSAFALVNIAGTSMFRAEMPSEPPVVVALGTTFSVVSISGATGSAVGIAYLLSGWLAWGLGALSFTLVYQLLLGLELGIAARTHPRGAQNNRGSGNR